MELGFAFPLWIRLLNISSCISWPLALFLFRTVHQLIYPFINWSICILGLSFGSLFILDVNLLPNEQLAKIFFHFLNCLLIPAIVFFTVQKLLVWCNPICHSCSYFKSNYSLIQKSIPYAYIFKGFSSNSFKVSSLK
jgi:hypothetical protein